MNDREGINLRAGEALQAQGATSAARYESVDRGLKSFAQGKLSQLLVYSGTILSIFALFKAKGEGDEQAPSSAPTKVEEVSSPYVISAAESEALKIGQRSATPVKPEQVLEQKNSGEKVR